MAKRLLVFGPPGVGKGTHARRLALDLGIPHVSTGDILRRGIADGTPLGLRAAVQMNAGALAPDDVVVAIVAARLAAPDTAPGYLLDGFPRNLAQAEAYDRQLSGPPADPAGGDVVLSLEAPDAVLLPRLVGRQTCAGCGASYNRSSRPPRLEGRCDDCGAPLTVRPDDQPDTVRRRLQAYHLATAPVLGYLAGRGWPVRAVPSVGEVDEVYARIRAAAGPVAVPGAGQIEGP
jgi:adenylate kinase